MENKEMIEGIISSLIDFSLEPFSLKFIEIH